MVKFRNINKINSVVTSPEASSAVSAGVGAVAKKTSPQPVSAEPTAEKKTVQKTVPRLSSAASKPKKVPGGSSRLGRSVLVLSLVVVIQIILLVSLIYLTPTLIK